MGRPPKRNLNYSTWDVDVLENDTSIDNLIDAQGPAGFYVYFRPYVRPTDYNPGRQRPARSLRRAAACHKERTCIQWRILNTPCRRLPKM